MPSAGWGFLLIASQGPALAMRPAASQNTPMKKTLLSLSGSLLAALALSACGADAPVADNASTTVPSSDPATASRVPTTETAQIGMMAAHDMTTRPYATPRSFDYMPPGGMLVFSATADWRHDSGISGANAFWSRLSDDRGVGLFITEDPRIFDDADKLAKFGVIVMNSATGDVLSASQQQAIEAFVEGGGGLVAQHAMGDSSLAKTWPWWEAQLGTEFISHPFDPQFQEADVVTLAQGHPVMDGLGSGFSMSDEWYTFTGVPSGDVVLLAGLDESTYSPVNKVYGQEDLRMGPRPSDHPIVWARCPGEGRVVYSALGHKADSYDVAEHRRLLENALAWVQADGPGCP